MSADEIAKAFCGHYYQTFTSNQVDSLKGLYNAGSMLTFEGAQCQGPDNIIAKYKSVGALTFNASTMDVQPCPSPDAMCIFVTGNVKIDGGNPLHFTQFFQLIATGPGQYYVHNDIFR
ncbi:unnamed protein product [Chrysoparadoxa australica]